jgi:type III pantothenate kinase
MTIDETALLAFDVGNTSAKLAARLNGLWHRLARVTTRPVGGLAERILAAVPPERIVELGVRRCVACSVYPQADEQVCTVWALAAGHSQVEFFGRDIAVPIDLKLTEPKTVGTDRLLLALGARERHGTPIIVVSAGTAVTVDLVDAGGAFAGGAIAPGFGLAARALHEHAAALPPVAPAKPRHDLGTNTEEAIASGVYWFCTGGVRALVGRYRALSGDPELPVVCTGSDSHLLLPDLAGCGALHEPDLIYLGMAAALASP